MLDSTNKPNPWTLRPWKNPPNRWGWPWLVPSLETEDTRPKIRIVNNMGEEMAATLYTTQKEKNAVQVCAYFAISAMESCGRLRGEAGPDYKSSQHIGDIFEMVPLLKRYLGVFEDVPWVSEELRHVLFHPSVQAMNQVRREALRETVGLKEGILFEIKGRLDTAVATSDSNFCLIMPRLVSNHDKLRREADKLKKSPAGRNSTRSIFDEEVRKAAPEIVARNVAWKCIVGTMNACWKALDCGLGQPEHLPVLVKALREGRGDLARYAASLKSFKQEQGEELECALQKVDAAIECFDDPTDRNLQLLQATARERESLYKRWEGIRNQKRKRSVKAQHMLV